MKRIDLTFKAPISEVLEYISDSRLVNDKVKFDEKAGTPFMHIKESSGKLKITCEMLDRPVKDNGFLEGTYFKGTISEERGVCRIKGIILTAPIYHAICSVPLIASVVLSFFNPAALTIPIFFLASEFILLSGEFKKQGYIERYLRRAQKRLNAKK